MMNRYRIDWQAGMRLTDEIFRSADEYHLSCLQPLYSLLVNGDYGFMSLPVFRYELADSTLSVTQLEVDAISFSGKLSQMSCFREERPLFQNITLPNVTEPIVLFIDRSSEETVKLTNRHSAVPLCDADYQILVKLEGEHYSNPDAVPFARFIYKHGWTLDHSFIAPCVSLRANGTLLRSAANYVVELEALMKALKGAVETDQYVLIMSVLPLLNSISVEVQKESDKMTPRHLITLMQEVISSLLSLSDMERGVVVPERERCVSFVESHYTPYRIAELISEGIQLTHVLIGLVDSFSLREDPQPEPEVVLERPPRPAGRIISSTDSIRKKHH